MGIRPSDCIRLPTFGPVYLHSHLNNYHSSCTCVEFADFYIYSIWFVRANCTLFWKKWYIWFQIYKIKVQRRTVVDPARKGLPRHPRFIGGKGQEFQHSPGRCVFGVPQVWYSTRFRLVCWCVCLARFFNGRCDAAGETPASSR